MSTSAKPRRIVLFLTLILLIGAVVLAVAGFYAGRNAPAPMRQPDVYGGAKEQGSASSQPAVAPPRFLEKPYYIAQPSMGFLQQRLALGTIKIESQQPRRAVAAYPAGGHDIVAGMKVILYDAQDFALADKGVIARVESGRVLIDLPVSIVEPVRAEVILAETQSARRVPVEAVVDDAVWLAAVKGDGSAVLTRVPVEGQTMRNAHHVHIAEGLRADDYVVINPDAGLRKGDVLTNIEKVAVSAPLLDPADIARAQMEELRAQARRYAQEQVSMPDISGGDAADAVCDPEADFLPAAQ